MYCIIFHLSLDSLIADSTSSQPTLRATRSDQSIPMFQYFAQIISLLLGSIATDLQWLSQLSVVWQNHRSSCFTEWAFGAFLPTPPLGYTQHKMFLMIFLHFPLLCPCIRLISPCLGGMSVTGIQSEFHTMSLDVYTIGKHWEHDELWKDTDWGKRRRGTELLSLPLIIIIIIILQVDSKNDFMKDGI